MLPSAHEIRAAVLAARCLAPAGTPGDVAARSYAALPTGGLYGQRDLLLGERLLIDHGLLAENGSRLIPDPALLELAATDEREGAWLLLLRVIQAQQPAWLPFAARPDEPAEHLMPDDDLDVVRAILPDAARRELLLLALGRRYDPQLADERGAAGEDHVVDAARRQLRDAGRDDLAARVRRLSLHSDLLGYDVVAPTIDGLPHRMEVKTTAADLSIGSAEVNISRNEAATGERDATWSLVLVHQNGDDLRVVGWCAARQFTHLLPIDRGGVARWSDARLRLDLGYLTPGLPAAQRGSPT